MEWSCSTNSGQCGRGTLIWALMPSWRDIFKTQLGPFKEEVVAQFERIRNVHGVMKDRSAFKGLILESLDQLFAAEFIGWIFRVAVHLQDIKISRPSMGCKTNIFVQTNSSQMAKRIVILKWATGTELTEALRKCKGRIVSGDRYSHFRGIAKRRFVPLDACDKKALATGRCSGPMRSPPCGHARPMRRNLRSRVGI